MRRRSSGGGRRLARAAHAADAGCGARSNVFPASVVAANRPGGSGSALLDMVARAAAALLLLALGAAPLAAQERILSYDSEVDVRADGSLDVVEHITVVAEGGQIRRGIYRDFPTSYRDRYGNRVRVGLEVLGVERDGRPEPWFTERVSNGVRINTGDDSFLPVPGEFTFTIRYRTTRQLGFFEEHDELYWNAIGTGWVFPIEHGSAVVRLPEPVPPPAMDVEAYTGPQGARGADYRARVTAPGEARFELAAPLGRREGFTIVVTFPKRVVAEPTGADRFRWFLADNRGILLALAGLLALLAFCFVRWSKVGREPNRGVVIPRYYPPDGHTPAAARYLRRMGYDSRCFTSDVLDLAVAGHLRIHREEKRFRKDEWRLDRNGATPARSPEALQQRLLDRLFRFRSDSTDINQSNASLLSAARTAHSKALEEELHGRFFKRNSGSVVMAALIGLAVIGLAFLVSGGHGIPAIMAIGVVALGTLIVFSKKVRAYTPEGRKLMDAIEGLRLYLGVAERDELAGMAGPGGPPPLDASRYEALLPFAVALDVEDAWTRKFTAAVGAAAAAEATRRMVWYSGTGAVTDLGSFTRSLGSGLSSQIASASSPPGSSSGSGGGGSSGGGGGGGGGGGR